MRAQAFLDPGAFVEVGSTEVYDKGAPVSGLNDKHSLKWKSMLKCGGQASGKNRL